MDWDTVALAQAVGQSANVPAVLADIIAHYIDDPDFLHIGNVSTTDNPTILSAVVKEGNTNWRLQFSFKNNTFIYALFKNNRLHINRFGTREKLLSIITDEADDFLRNRAPAARSELCRQMYDCCQAIAKARRAQRTNKN